MSLIRVVNVLSWNKSGYRQTIGSLARYSDITKKDESSSTNNNDDSSSSSSSSSSSDDEAKKAPTSVSVASVNRLNKLLFAMKNPPAQKVALQMPQPIGYEKLKKRLTPPVAEPPMEPKPKSLEVATKEVADDIGGDVKKTESELINKLLSYERQPGQQSLLELISSMKTEPTPQRKSAATPRMSNYSKPDFLRKPSGNPFKTQWEDKRPTPRVHVKLFDNQPLNIFDADKLVDVPEMNKTWMRVHNETMIIKRPPANYFEKMAKWTEEGKVWTFPIDNEQGRDEEALSSFADHIFFDEQLSWCPSRGPVRNFMDLVCVGLSKNPYLTVQQKHEHIEWYKNYFEEKKDVLERSIILDTKPQTPEITQ